MSPWREARNAAAEARLRGALPLRFPEVVLNHAVTRTWIPQLPRLAVENYWTAHPLRADRLARALAARSGAPEGWRWSPSEGARGGFREAPTPFREERFRPGPGRCCICGQPVFRLGWHVDLWEAGPNRRAGWHAACVAAWKLWAAPNLHLKFLGRLQGRRCALSGKRLLRDAEADHRVPLFQVWRNERERPWPDLLGFWGFPNLQAVNSAAHRTKSAGETTARAASRLIALSGQSASV